MKLLAQATLLFRIATRSLYRNPRRSIVMLLAITVAVWGSLAMTTIARGLSYQMSQDAIRELTGHLKIQHAEYQNDPVIENSMEDPSPLLQALFASEKIQHWSTRVRVPGVIQSEQEAFGISIVGIDPEAERGLSFIPDDFSAGRFLTSPADNGLIIGKKLAEQLQTKVGRRVVLMTEHADGTVSDRGFRVVGIYDSELESTEKAYVFTGRSVLQEFLGMGTQVSELSLIAADRDNLQPLKEKISVLLPGAAVLNWTELQPLAAAILRIQSGFLRLWFSLVYIAVAFGLMNTLFMAIYERVREIGLVQALGMQAFLVLLQVVLEAAVLIAWGVLLGDGLTFATLFWLRDGIDISGFAQGTEMMGGGSRIFPRLIPGDLIFSNGLIAVIGLLCSLYPAWRASRHRPAEALSKG